MINMFRLPRNAPRRLWAVVAQLLALLALGLGLQFVFWTSGGTLFLYSAAAPLLILISIVIVTWLALTAFRRRHSVFEFQTFHAGDVVYHRGDPADCVYFIEEGEVEVSRIGPGEKEKVVRLNSGDYFGEMSLLADQPRRSATVRAVLETRAAAIGKDNFMRMLFSMPVVRDSILQTAHSRFMNKAEP